MTLPAPRNWIRSATGAAAVMLLVSFVVRVPTLAMPLIEHHTWRQTQTAYTAREFARNGIDLLHAQLPVLGPPFAVPFELPLFQAGAAVLIRLGLSDDVASRLMGLITFMASAWLLWLLIRRLTSARVATIALLAYVASPLNLVFGRAALIEYLAVAAALTFAYAAVRWADERRPGWLLLAVLAGAVSATVKLPTFAPWPMLVFGYLLDRRYSLRDRRTAGLLVCVGLALVAGVAWTAYADAIKAASPFTARLTSAALFSWNFGTIAQRLDPVEWNQIASNLGAIVLGIGWLPLLAFAPRTAATTGRSLTALGAAGVAVMPPLVFFNLYAEHDYYAVATAPAWAFLLGLGGARLFERWPRQAVPVVALAIAVSLVPSFPYWATIYRGPRPDAFAFLDQAAELKANSTPDELAVVIGDDWIPTALYYADRRGLAAPPWVVPRDLEGQESLYRAASVRDPAAMDLYLLTAWRWVAPVGARTYRLGRDAVDMPADAIRWTSVAGPGSGSRIRAQRVVCSGPSGQTTLPSGPSGTLLTFSPIEAPSARLWMNGLAPVPAIGQVYVPPGTPLVVACAGAGSIQVELWRLPG